MSFNGRNFSRKAQYRVSRQFGTVRGHTHKWAWKSSSHLIFTRHTVLYFAHNVTQIPPNGKVQYRDEFNFFRIFVTYWKRDSGLKGRSAPLLLQLIVARERELKRGGGIWRREMEILRVKREKRERVCVCVCVRRMCTPKGLSEHS